MQVPPEIEIKRITAADTHDIRHVMLQPGRPREDCDFSDDSILGTFHLGAFWEGRHVGITTVYHKDNETVFAAVPEIQRDKMYQLRGMATLPEYQGRGIGRALLEEACRSVRELHGELLWINARTVAVPFYEVNSFTLLGDEFEIPGIGPNYLMWRML